MNTWRRTGSRCSSPKCGRQRGRSGCRRSARPPSPTISIRSCCAASSAKRLPLSPIAPAATSAQDLIASVIALCCCGAVRPVEPGDASVAALNRALLDRVGGNEEIGALALPCGTSIRVEPALLHALRDGRRPGDPVMAGWFDFLSGAVQL